MSSGPTVTFNLQRDPIFTTILLSWDGQCNSISFSIFIVALPLERTFRKYLSIKLKRLHRLQILPEMVVLFPIKRPLPLQSSLLIYRHKNTSSPEKKKKQKEKTATRKPPAGGKGEKGSQRAPPTGA